MCVSVCVSVCVKKIEKGGLIHGHRTPHDLTIAEAGLLFMSVKQDQMLACVEKSSTVQLYQHRGSALQAVVGKFNQ